MSDSVLIRQADPSEYGRIGHVAVEAFSSSFEVSDDYRADLLDISGHAKKFNIWIAVDNAPKRRAAAADDADDEATADRILGLVLTPKTAELNPSEASITYPGEREFRMLGVIPAARGRGVGRKLINQAVRQLGALGVRTVGIHTGLRMVGARHLYESYGFTRRTERETVIVDHGYRLLTYTYPVPDEYLVENPALDRSEALRGVPTPSDGPGSIEHVVAALQDNLPADTVFTDDSSIEAVLRDRSVYGSEERPVAVVFPRTRDEVSATLRIASAYEFPVYTRGKGSGLAGGAVPTRSGIVLDLTRMNAIGDVDPINRSVHVQAGAITADINNKAHEHGLFYAPDPASSAISSIGGNIATNAGGFHCVKYGVTRDSLLSLTVVLADGTPLTVGAGTVKDVSGLDLMSLITGSEGTLAVVTDATLRLHPVPQNVSTIVAFAETLEQAGDGVKTVFSETPVQPSVFELMAVPQGLENSATYSEACQDRPWLLLLQTEDTHSAENAAHALRDNGFTVVRPGDTDIDRLLTLRRQGKPYPANSWMAGGDVAVPIGALPQALAKFVQIAKQHHAEYSIVSHVGDGNLHTAYFMVRDDGIDEPPSPDQPLPDELADARDEWIHTALALGGTLTGEHGIGIDLAQYLPEQLGNRSLDIQRQIKKTFDPQGILNPGKWI